MHWHKLNWIQEFKISVLATSCSQAPHAQKMVLFIEVYIHKIQKIKSKFRTLIPALYAFQPAALACVHIRRLCNVVQPLGERNLEHR